MAVWLEVQVADTGVVAKHAAWMRGIDHARASSRSKSTLLLKTMVPNAPIRVLVIDDDEAMVRALCGTLSRSGFEASAAHDALEGLRQITGQAPPQVVLCDVGMPGLDGVQFLAAISDAHPELPIVMITGDPRVETAVAAVRHGAVGYLVKPPDRAELVGAVKRAVTMSRLAALRRDSTTLTAPSQKDNLALSFERALNGCSFVYQPIVSVSERRVVGYEAYVRCAEPSLATPAGLFSAAEELGRVSDLTRRLRRDVVRPLDGRRSDDTLLFVNLHLHDLEDEDLFDSASPLGRVAERVVLELAERESLATVEDLKQKVFRLRALGFRVALDDVGLSYSGLNSFAQIEPDIVKFDMSLVRGLPVLPVKRRIVTSLVELCRDLDMKTIAEGVEVEDEAIALEKIGCVWQQGFFHAKPGPAFPTVPW